MTAIKLRIRLHYCDWHCYTPHFGKIFLVLTMEGIRLEAEAVRLILTRCQRGEWLLLRDVGDRLGFPLRIDWGRSLAV
ncbi:MAG: hypothetical protein DSM106950_33395 [Stigonema ocellatum SAG 48.90 = DSM 106950]|nr:hypothetical protein [Stigonema ocellatum SAG 48.90 = DSM 106950]